MNVVSPTFAVPVANRPKMSAITVMSERAPHKMAGSQGDSFSRMLGLVQCLDFVATVRFDLPLKQSRYRLPQTLANTL